MLQSSSEDETAPQAQNKGRSSDRIRYRKRKTVQRPTRDEQWNAISTRNVSAASISTLRPRKLINDFMKVTNRYNHDQAETSGEESMNEFLNDTGSTSGSSDSEKANTQKKVHRIKGYRSRIRNLASESSEEETDHDTSLPNTSSVKDKENNGTAAKQGFITPSVDGDKTNVLSSARDRRKRSTMDDDESSTTPVTETDSGTRTLEEASNKEESSITPTVDSDPEDVLAPRRDIRKQSVLNSSTDDDDSSRSSIGEPSSEASPAKNLTENLGSVKGETEREPEETSDEEYNGPDESRIRKLSSKRKKKRDSVFSEFRAARAKLKKTQ